MVFVAQGQDEETEACGRLLPNRQSIDGKLQRIMLDLAHMQPNRTCLE